MKFDYSPDNIAQIESEHDLPPGIMLALHHAENSSDTAVSPKGAVGEFQVLPTTAANPGYGVQPFDPRDPKGIAGYVKALYEHAGKDPVKTAAAYNAGLGGNPNNPETKGYTQRFEQHMQENAPVQVQLPDGRKLQFPAGTSRDVILKASKRYLGTPEQAPQAPKAEPLTQEQENQRKMLVSAGFPPDQAEAAARANKTEFLPDIPGGAPALSAVGKLLGIGQKTATPLQTAARDAQKLGYKVPPSQVKEGPIRNALEGLGGKVQLQQEASIKNQKLTNKLAARALGLPEDVPMTVDAIKTARATAGTAYEAVKKVPFKFRVDAGYERDIADLAKEWKQASKEFPMLANPEIDELITGLSRQVKGPGGATALKKIEPADAITLVKQLRYKAAANLRNADNPEKLALGRAQKNAAEIVDDVIERNLRTQSNAGMYRDYMKARQLIAKSYDVEGALNESTGNVSAQSIGKLGAKGRPLTAELRDISKTAQAFPKSTQNVENIAAHPRISVLDLFGAAINPKYAAAIIARPAVRELLLSPAFQNETPQMVKDLVKQAITDAAKTAAQMEEGQTADQMKGAKRGTAP